MGMSLNTILDDAVLQAEMLAASGERQIAEQKRIMERMLQSGRSTAACEVVLRAMLHLQSVRLKDLEYWRSRAAAPVFCLHAYSVSALTLDR